MLRQKPQLTYNGLTVVMSNPSRADTHKLLSAGGGRFFNECLAPEYNMYQADIRLKEDVTPLIDGTKVVLLLGEDAAKQWLKNPDNTINEIRGSVYTINEKPFIATYFPQDCVDIKNYEKAHHDKRNADSGHNISEDAKEDSETDSLEDKSRHGKTKRKNFRFWFQKDIERVKILLKSNGVIPKEPEAVYHIYPSAEVVIAELLKHKGKFFYYDCETDENLNITCFGFSFGLPNVFVVPCIDHLYNWCYSSLPQILRALAVCIRDNTIVAHNGASFDFPVLGIKLKIPIGKHSYDTMLAHHRCFPDVEKSLGHGMSIWTWQPFHKDENSGWYNSASMKNTMQYCGKDVYGMILLHEAITAYAKKRPGLTESIQQAMDSIRPYLITFFMGIRVIAEKRDAMFKENDRLMIQYNRIIRILIGPIATKALLKMSKKSMAGSNMQCCKYFHEMLGYDVQNVSKETGKPSLAKQALFKLALAYKNPVIQVVVAYRELAKESGSLKWTPLKE